MRVLLVCLGLLALGGPILAIDLTITPEAPLEGDVALVSFVGECGTGQGRTFSYAEEGRTLILTVEEINCPCGQMCATVCVPFKAVQTLGSLRAGEYTLKGVYRLLDGCTGELLTERRVEKTFIVSSPPQAPALTFTHKPAHPRAGEEVSFVVHTLSQGGAQLSWYGWDWESDGSVDLVIQLESSDQGPVYTWDFDLDGDPERTTDKLDGIKHLFSSPGTHRVTLQARDEQGMVTKVTRDIMVRPSTISPAAQFSWEVLSQDGDYVRVKFVIQLRERTSGSMPTTYMWDWDSDGEIEDILTEPVVEHTFSLPGPFMVTLLVRDQTGSVAGVTRTIMISEH